MRLCKKWDSILGDSAAARPVPANGVTETIIYCKTLIFSEPFNLAKVAIEIKTLKIKAVKIK